MLNHHRLPSTLFFIALIPFFSNLTPIKSEALEFRHGPYLTEASETAVTVMWHTDVDCFSKVEYGTGGTLQYSAESVTNGLVDVGQQHRIRLSGLMAGQTYQYRIKSTQVAELKAYYSVMGSTIVSTTHSLTTFNKSKPVIAFNYITDTHSQGGMVKTLTSLADWSATDFMVTGGDMSTTVDDESEIFNDLIDPIVSVYAAIRPTVFVRGNHEWRGAYARQLYRHTSNFSGAYYTDFTHGPAHFTVLDTGEDKADADASYGGLIRSEAYRRAELDWWKDITTKQAARLTTVPFRIALLHQPRWGHGSRRDWVAQANKAGVDLIIGGHEHEYSHNAPGRGRNYHSVVVGKNQLARFEVSATQIQVTVVNHLNALVDRFTIPAAAKRTMADLNQ